MVQHLATNAYPNSPAYWDPQIYLEEFPIDEVTKAPSDSEDVPSSQRLSETEEPSTHTTLSSTSAVIAEKKPVLKKGILCLLPSIMYIIM